jgi:hypothetical protein
MIATEAASGVQFSIGLRNGDWLGVYPARACPPFPGKVGGSTGKGRFGASPR